MRYDCRYCELWNQYAEKCTYDGGEGNYKCILDAEADACPPEPDGDAPNEWDFLDALII